MAHENDKRTAAASALAEVADGMTLGLGTGSTAAELVRLLGARVRAGLRVRAVATSRATELLARAQGIPIASLDATPGLDLAIDGADAIDPALRLVKGHGGALLYEKIVAASAARFVVIADASKAVASLSAVTLPVEVVRFALPLVMRRIRALGGEPTLRSEAGAPFMSDAGNYILDCRLDLGDPDAVSAALRAIPGVIEHGLFAPPDAVYLADRGQVSVRTAASTARSGTTPTPC